MTRSIRRALAGLTVIAAGMLAIGLQTTPAMALNPDSYNILKNAQRNQLCLDIDAPTLQAHLWSCHHPVTSNQQYLLFAPPGQSPDEWKIKSQLGNVCLKNERPFQNSVVSCSAADIGQRWFLKSTGEIVSTWDGTCLDAQGDFDGARVVQNSCNGSISQRWFF